MTGPRILVVDGDQRSALAVVRSLGQAGYHVEVGASIARSLAGGSRHARREIVLPDPLLVHDEFVAAVEREVRQCLVDVVLPMTEASLLALLPERDRLLPATLPFPDAATFRAVCDKEQVLAEASEIGIGVPRQLVAHAPGEVERIAAALRFPLVLKPSRSVSDVNGTGRSKLSVVHVAGADALRAAAATLPAAAYPLLVQERIVGAGIGIFLLMWNGRVVASFAHRRIREKPPSGGVSVYRESIAADPALVERSHALLDRFGWSGVAMVEYKLDRATGEPSLMEINGRFWGSLQLAIDAGVDFPRLLVECALGRAPTPVTDYRIGVRSRWWWGDVDHLLARLRRSREELGLTDEEPSRLGAIAHFLALWRPGDRSEVLRLRDPRPFMRETAAWFAALRRAQSHGGASGARS